MTINKAVATITSEVNTRESHVAALAYKAHDIFKIMIRN